MLFDGRHHIKQLASQHIKKQKVNDSINNAVIPKMIFKADRYIVNIIE